MLSVGDIASNFTCKGSRGEDFRLSDYANKKNVLLVFYPKDDTPGCTRQLCALRDDASAFDELDTVCVGVNPAGAESHNKFIEKFSFQFTILVDEDKQVARMFGAVEGEDEHEKIKRTVVIVKKDGTVGYYKQGLPLDSELIAAIKTF